MAYELPQFPIVFPSLKSLKDPFKTMKCVEFHGNQDLRVVVRQKPVVTDPCDAIIRISSTTICGSDLHFFHDEISGMQKGDILGHEFMGWVEDIGTDVKNLQIGDRVVVSAVIACGKCWYCKNGSFSCCDTTNPSKEMEKMYGHRLAGIFGYSHLTGGYDGGQAEFARVPYADVNCLKITSPIPDEKVLFLSDILCTGWHACVQGEVSAGKTVAIWGSGPVGLAAMMWAKFLGAKRIIAIDSVPYRLNVASYRFGAETINFEEKDVYQTMRELVPGGPDVCIDAVGFRFPKTLLHKIERTLHLETDAPQVLTEAIMCCRKAGNIVIIGDYFAYANHFPIGALMEKSLVTRGGQVYVQKYWKELLGYIESGKVDPTFLVTHHMSLDDAPRAYKIFDQKEENAIKIILKPSPVEPK